MSRSRTKYAPMPWLAAMCGLLGLWAALLLPAIHAHVGWDDEGDGEITACVGGCASSDHASSSEPVRDHSPHHNSSTCDICKQILILQTGVASAPRVFSLALDVPAIDARGPGAHTATSLPKLDVRRARGPPAV